MIYRQKTEPKTEVFTTSTNAALYELDEQISILKRFNEMYDAMSGCMLEEDYGMVILPGLISTRTLTSDDSKNISICTSMTPQGICIAGDYILVSAYCHTHTHNSVIYVIDKQTGAFIKEIVLKGKAHVGGLAFDTKHHMIWVSSGNSDRASVSAFSLGHLRSYNLEKKKKPIVYTHNHDLYTLEKDSFMTYADGYLYIGHFSMEKSSVLQKFEIDAQGDLKTQSGVSFGVDREIAIPKEVKKIPDRIQGIAIYKEKVILTQSYGWSPSKLLVYNDCDSIHRTEEPYTINRISMPQKLEQIYIDGDDLYVLFESAAYAYSAQPLEKVDRICRLSLNKVIKEDIENQKNGPV